MRSPKGFSVLAILFAFPSLGHAGGKLPPEFTLGRYIPADAWLYVHGVDNPERRWIDDRWKSVMQSVLDSGIDEDIKNLVFPLIPAEQRDEVRKHLDRLGESVRTVKWSEMSRHEFVFAERISAGGLSYDYVVLARGERESAEHNFKALTGILEHLAGFSEKIGVQSFDLEGASVVALGEREASAEKVTQPLVWLIHKGDIIGAALSPPVGERNQSIMDDVLGLMSGKKRTPCIVESPRFREALSNVETPRDAITFFDIKTMFGNLRNMFDTIDRQVGADKEHERKMVGAFTSLIRQADIVDYSISSARTQGRRTLTEEFTRYQADKTDRPLARMCLERNTFERFDQYIPKNATSFSLSAGIDIGRLYDFAIGFVEKSIPGGDQIKSNLESIYEQIGFDPERDLFSWWSGETIEMSMPASIVTPMGGSSDWVTMIRVKNPELASCRVNGAIDWANKKLQQRGQMLIVSPANCKVGSFREITHPMLAMVARPVIGVQDDWLVVSKSADTVNKCIAVANGDAPSIMKNERFRKEGLIPDGPVHSLSFEDLSRRGEEWAGAAAAFGMIGGMASGMMPQETPQEVRGLIQATTGIIAKLAPALQRIDFYSSQSSVGVREGETAFRKRTVVTYKPPTPPNEKVARQPE